MLQQTSQATAAPNKRTTPRVVTQTEDAGVAREIAGVLKPLSPQSGQVNLTEQELSQLLKAVKGLRHGEAALLLPCGQCEEFPASTAQQLGAFLLALNQNKGRLTPVEEFISSIGAHYANGTSEAQWRNRIEASLEQFDASLQRAQETATLLVERHGDMICEALNDLGIEQGLVSSVENLLQHLADEVRQQRREFINCSSEGLVSPDQDRGMKGEA